MEVPPLGVQTVVVALTEIDADGDLQAGPGDQGGHVAGPAGGGKAFVDPMLDLFLGEPGHILEAALGQAAFADEPVGELEVGPPQIDHRRIQDQDIDRHQSNLHGMLESWNGGTMGRGPAFAPIFQYSIVPIFHSR